MSVPPHIVKCYKYVDVRKGEYAEELRKIVAIAGIASDPKSHKKLSLLIEWLENRLKDLGFDVELKDAGNYTPEGSTSRVQIPLLVLGTLGRSANKKTLLYYCHLDVADVNAERWNTGDDQFSRDEKLYGRGTARMKGPLLCFVHAIESYRAQSFEVPVNVKIFCECMHQVGSPGVDDALEELKAGFLVGIDCVLINDGNWIGPKEPCLIHGSRGLCIFDLCVEGPKRNLHSGEYGGILYEPFQDLFFIVNALVDFTGRVKIPGFYDDVVQITPDEEDTYHNLKVDMENYRKTARLYKLAHGGKAKRTLMNVWRNPSLNFHFIDSNLKCERPVRLTIPKRVTARFSIRLVPRQSPERVCRLLYRYVEQQLRERCTPNNVTLKGHEGTRPWLEDHLHWNYEAAKVATKQVYKRDANLIREGKVYPTLLKFRQALSGTNILVLPVVNSESNAGKEGENISLSCYIESTKLLTSYLHQLSVLSQ